MASHGPDGSIPDWAIETVDQPGHVGIMGEVGHEPTATSTGGVVAIDSLPRWPRPTAVPPRHLAGRSGGRSIVDDALSLIAIGVDRSVWLDARG